MADHQLFNGRFVPDTVQHHRHQESAAAAPRVRTRFEQARTWQCPCGAQLVIRSHEALADGPSNFLVNLNPKDRQFGHSIIPSGRLNAEGLREERGWERDGDVVKCPACVMGRTRGEQRLIPHEQRTVEIAARHITRQSGGTIQAEAVFTRLLPSR